MGFFDWLFGKNNETATDKEPVSSTTLVGADTSRSHDKRENLRRWRGSGEPLQWIQAHQGQWNHEDWLALLKTLQDSDYWPMEPEAVGLVLEELKQKWMGR